jgi:large exoprotein involved in heme utilization and adhesion
MNAGTRIDSSTLWDGNAGQIAGNVGSVALNDGAQIRSQSGGVAVSSGQPSVGFGEGGSVTFTADDSILITGSNSAVSTNTFGNGNGGSISLIAGKLVSIQNGGRVSADSGGTLGGQQFSGSGLAGDITIAAGDQIAMNSGSVSTRAITADGGNIILNAPNLIELTNSQITTSVESGVGSGGNITIDPQALILNNSKIVANAFGGPGGNINITADVFLVNSNGAFPTSLTGIVDASSALSTPGTVNIQANFTNVTGSVTLLPETPLKATELLRAACAARFAGGKTSSLVLGGRDGRPLEPGGLLPSPLYVANNANTAAPGATTMTGYSQFSDLSFLGSRDRHLDRYTLLPNSKCS